MNILLIASFLGTVGKVLLGIAVYRVHNRVIKEQKIDAAVLKEMKFERRITLLGIIFIILEFILIASYYLNIDLLGLYL